MKEPSSHTLVLSRLSFALREGPHSPYLPPPPSRYLLYMRESSQTSSTLSHASHESLSLWSSLLRERPPPSDHHLSSYMTDSLPLGHHVRHKRVRYPLLYIITYLKNTDLYSRQRCSARSIVFRKTNRMTVVVKILIQMSRE